MNNIVVTLKENVEVNEEGDFLFHDTESSRIFADTEIEGEEFDNENDKNVAWKRAFDSIMDTHKLKNLDDVGVLAKTHVVPISSLDKAGNVVADVVALAEVYWEFKRCPAPAMVDPSTLVWLSIVDQDDQEEEGEEQETDSDTEGGEEIETEYQDVN